MSKSLEALAQEREAYEAQQRVNRLFTLSLAQKAIIAVVVIAWALLLNFAGDMNLAAPLVKAEQEYMSGSN